MKINKTLTKKLISEVISNYNSTYHSSMHTTPNEAKGKAIESELRHNQRVVDVISNEFQIGDHVRYRLKPKTFQKESAKWSKTVYQIDSLDGYRFHIKSVNNHVLYKAPNDLKIFDASQSEADVDKNQIWTVEKILDHQKQRNGKNKYLTKWQGYDEPTWELQDNLRLINKTGVCNGEGVFSPL